MINRELLKQIRQVEIKTRGVVNEVFSGEYHSVFKGRGMEFSEVREYQFGDDIRSIDWNVTARMNNPFVKIFEEERELTVVLLIDMSGSLAYGTFEKTKQQIAAELSAILAFSAMKNNDKVGLILFTDIIEKFVPPRKGKSHGLRLIREILNFVPQGNQTNISSALEFFNHAVKKKSIAFIISDFIDEGYEQLLKIAGKKHDLVAITLEDKTESVLPDVGLLQVKDSETGKVRYLDTSDRKVRNEYEEFRRNAVQKRNSTFLKGGIDNILINTEDSYILPLINFFKKRERR